MQTRHILSVLLKNTSGALSRVVGLFSARGYNIESLTVAPTESDSISRMTIVSYADEKKMEQITKHLNRIIEVIKVYDLMESDYVERELMLIKVRAIGRDRDAAHHGNFPCARYRRHRQNLHDRSHGRQPQA